MPMQTLPAVYFKALADDTRIRLLHILSNNELNVNELVAVLGMGQSRISRHLKILTSARLLTWRRDGLWVFYSSPESGADKSFIDAVIPFVANNPFAAQDCAAAAALIAERTRKTQQFFNSIAEDWDKLSKEVLGSFSLPEAIARIMPQCAVACDLGCGTGSVLEVMLEKAGLAIGVDGSARMLELAQKRFSPDNSRISLRIGDLAHLPLRDGEADFVTLNLVLHHLSTPVDVLQEVFRIIKPGGRLVITDYTSHSDETMRSEYGDLWLGFTTEELHNALKRARFSVTESTEVPIERNLSLHIIQATRPADLV